MYVYTMNILLAIVLGTVIDSWFTRIDNNKISIALQLLVSIGVFRIIEIIYKRNNLTSLGQSVFFISVFLGVQRNLFNNIDDVFKGGEIKERERRLKILS
jgi:hypothetical protein